MRSIQMFLTVVLLYAVGLLESAQGQSLACPAVRTSSGWLDLFPLPCKKHAECRSVMGKQHLCCKGFCTKGIAAQRIANDVMGSVVASSTSTTTTTTTTSTTTSTTTTTPSTTSSTTTTTTTTAAPRPFLQLLPIQTTQAAVAKKISKTTSKSQKLVCPKGQSPLVLFPIPCENNAQCRSSSGADHVCCERRCVKGVPAPRPKPAPAPRNHQPLLGVIPRECPSTPLGELLFEVQSCKTDSDCWPRLCCPDGTRSYCRTARARLDLVPVANQIDGPVRMFEQYLQCTAPPKLDLFPRPCSSSVDCFPNLCCAEGGKKHCRPPLRSLLALLAGVTQRVGSTLGNLRRGAAQNNNKV